MLHAKNAVYSQSKKMLLKKKNAAHLYQKMLYRWALKFETRKCCMRV